MVNIKEEQAVNDSEGFDHTRRKTQVQLPCTFSKSLFHWEQEETCVNKV